MTRVCDEVHYSITNSDDECGNVNSVNFKINFETPIIIDELTEDLNVTVGEITYKEVVSKGNKNVNPEQDSIREDIKLIENQLEECKKFMTSELGKLRLNICEVDFKKSGND